MAFIPTPCRLSEHFKAFFKADGLLVGESTQGVSSSLFCNCWTFLNGPQKPPDQVPCVIRRKQRPRKGLWLVRVLRTSLGSRAGPQGKSSVQPSTVIRRMDIPNHQMDHSSMQGFSTSWSCGKFHKEGSACWVRSLWANPRVPGKSKKLKQVVQTHSDKSHQTNLSWSMGRGGFQHYHFIMQSCRFPHSSSLGR
jgi:hypothetical protein